MAVRRRTVAVLDRPVAGQHDKDAPKKVLEPVVLGGEDAWVLSLVWSRRGQRWLEHWSASMVLRVARCNYLVACCTLHLPRCMLHAGCHSFAEERKHHVILLVEVEPRLVHPVL